MRKPQLSPDHNTGPFAKTSQVFSNLQKRGKVGHIAVIALGTLVVSAFVSSLTVWRSTQHLTSNTKDESSSEPSLLRKKLQESRVSLKRDEEDLESLESLRQRLPATIWSTRQLPDFITSAASATTDNAGSDAAGVNVTELINQQLKPEEKTKALQLCGNFLYSSLQRAVQVGDLSHHVFVATGDIDDMWTRDSVVQMAIYLNRGTTASYYQHQQSLLRFWVEGAIRRNAYNILEDPYGNAYSRFWRDPKTIQLREAVIGRGGHVATRNYELDSGGYFMTQLYDYYVSYAPNLYRPEKLLEEPLIFEAVLLMVNIWIVEQHHEEQSPYRYFELPRDGLGSQTNYTGMTWTGFRPSDDPCQYGYLVPANILAAAGLERMLVLNQRIWHHDELRAKASKLLQDITQGIEAYGIVKMQDTGERVYAYEVDGLGGVLDDFDDANVPSLLSIPLLGWSGYNKEVYRATRRRILSKKNSQYYEGSVLKGIGSPHTPPNMIWPMALVMEALTEYDEKVVVERIVFQIRQLLKAACNDAMHEGVSTGGCPSFTRHWFEWANALFVVLIESALGVRCDDVGRKSHLEEFMTQIMSKAKGASFYSNPHGNDAAKKLYYQGIEASVKHFDHAGGKKR